MMICGLEKCRVKTLLTQLEDENRAQKGYYERICDNYNDQNYPLKVTPSLVASG